MISGVNPLGSNTVPLRGEHISAVPKFHCCEESISTIIGLRFFCTVTNIVNHLVKVLLGNAGEAFLVESVPFLNSLKSRTLILYDDPGFLVGEAIPYLH
jgi:hypothetical protein